MLDTCYIVHTDKEKEDFELPKTKHNRRGASAVVFGDHPGSEKIFVYVFSGSKTAVPYVERLTISYKEKSWEFSN
jgi:hypothetical protein